MFRVTPAELRAALKLPNRRGGGRRADRTVKTIMSSVTIHSRRVNGAQGDFGDLTWITVDSLKLPSQDPAVRPVVDGAAHPSASGAAAVPLALSTRKRLIEDLRRDLGCAVLMVSHELHVVMSASDRVICLNGHVCCEGAPEYRALFGSGTQGALALYRHDHDHHHNNTHLHDD